MRIKDDYSTIEQWIKDRSFDIGIYNKFKHELKLFIRENIDQHTKLGCGLTDELDTEFSNEDLSKVKEHDKIVQFYLVQTETDGKAFDVLYGNYFLMKGDYIVGIGKMDYVKIH